ncbi:MAG: DUF2092 domain-containing protein [Verrucomicrobiota bacterium]|nr:DUF2092 domain-containing protein [Verrucomicrobiota bacterium]
MQIGANLIPKMKLILSIAFLCSSVTLARAQVVETAAKSILEKMAATYAAMQSYSDTIIVHYRNPDGTEGGNAECKIWFDRPIWFRIDGESRMTPDAPPKREVIWCDGKTTRSWTTARAVTTLSHIQLAGSKMFGAYAYHIPTLLQKSYAGPRRLNNLDSPALAEEETIDGVECFHLRGKWFKDPYELWLGKNDYVVRKIAAIYRGYGMEELHRNIAINPTIPIETFQFEPEKEAAAPAK